jgi:hypothetical protein
MEDRRCGQSRAVQLAKFSEGTMIDKANLQDGAYYRGKCRNATIARWDGTLQKFFHWRIKFGHRFIEEIRHPDDEAHFDVFAPEHVLPDDVIKDLIPLPRDKRQVIGARE